MLTLGIETATDLCAVALVQDDRCLASDARSGGRVHATQLAPLVDGLLRAAGVTPAALDAVAVSAGPGSYTGLRIGVSTAKGLCLATGAVLVAVPTLDALAEAAREAAAGHPLATVLRSRHGEVYLAVYAGAHPLLPAQAVALDDLAAVLRHTVPPGSAPLCLVGDAAADAEAVCTGTALPVALLDVPVSAVAVAQLSERLATAGRTADLAAFEPAYVTDFVPSQPNAILRPADP
jgi:tRNA threonylcarbamoyladenosine biosynthesis protein TsaB